MLYVRKLYGSMALLHDDLHILLSAGPLLLCACDLQAVLVELKKGARDFRDLVLGLPTLTHDEGCIFVGDGLEI